MERSPSLCGRGKALRPNSLRSAGGEPRGTMAGRVAATGSTPWRFGRAFAQRPLISRRVTALSLAAFIFDAVVVSACVQFGLALPMISYFHRLSITGLSANIVIIPLLSLVVPFGFASHSDQAAHSLLCSQGISWSWRSESRAGTPISNPPGDWRHCRSGYRFAFAALTLSCSPTQSVGNAVLITPALACSASVLRRFAGSRGKRSLQPGKLWNCRRST